MLLWLTAALSSVAASAVAGLVNPPAACPKACGVCPPKGFTGACCHGNTTCETTNWTPATCTPAFGTWCGSVGPSPSPSPSPPSPSPGPPIPPPPQPQPLILGNYLISSLPNSSIGKSTHVFLSFLEPSTATIPAPGDDAWIKYAVALWAQLSAAERTAQLAVLHGAGTLVLASLGGSAATHGAYTKYDATLFGKRAAEYVIQLGLDGLDIDLEGWGNDPNGATFLGALTKGARAAFKAADPAKKWVVTHAPELPDFWHSSLYAALMADRETFDLIDFCNVQFYNQIPFKNDDAIFTVPTYSPAEKAPTSLTGVANAIAALSNGTISAAEANAKLVLGFPYKDGSFPIGGANLNQGGAAQFDLVKYGVDTLHYPLSGVFEWTASTVTVEEVGVWNEHMSAALHPPNVSTA